MFACLQYSYVEVLISSAAVSRDRASKEGIKFNEVTRRGSDPIGLVWISGATKEEKPYILFTLSLCVQEEVM